MLRINSILPALERANTAMGNLLHVPTVLNLGHLSAGAGRLRLGPIPRPDLHGKELVHLFERAAFRLGHHEDGKEQRGEGKDGHDEAEPGAEVGRRADQERDDRDEDDAEQDVDGRPEAHEFFAHPVAAHLGSEQDWSGVSASLARGLFDNEQLTRAALERDLDARQEQDQGGDDDPFLGGGDVVFRAQRADQDIADDQHRCAKDDGRASTKPVERDDADDGRSDAHTLADGGVYKHLLAKAQLFAVKSGAVDIDKLPAGGLRSSVRADAASTRRAEAGVNKANLVEEEEAQNDDCAATIFFVEQVKPPTLLLQAVMLGRRLDGFNLESRVAIVDLFLAAETVQSAQTVLVAAAGNEPSRRLGAEGHEEEDANGGNELNRSGDPVISLTLISTGQMQSTDTHDPAEGAHFVAERQVDARADRVADSDEDGHGPAHQASQRRRRDFGAVRRQCRGDECTDVFVQSRSDDVPVAWTGILHDTDSNVPEHISDQTISQLGTEDSAYAMTRPTVKTTQSLAVSSTGRSAVHRWKTAMRDGRTYQSQLQAVLHQQL